MIVSLSLLVQVSPPALWGEAMHTSGLFNHLLMNLVEGEVRGFLIMIDRSGFA